MPGKGTDRARAKRPLREQQRRTAFASLEAVTDPQTAEEDRRRRGPEGPGYLGDRQGEGEDRLVPVLGEVAVTLVPGTWRPMADLCPFGALNAPA